MEHCRGKEFVHLLGKLLVLVLVILTLNFDFRYSENLLTDGGSSSSDRIRAWKWMAVYKTGRLLWNGQVSPHTKFLYKFQNLFSSTEPKAQVGFSYQNLSSVVRCRRFHIVIFFSRTNFKTNFNQTWHNASLSKGDWDLFFSKRR